MTSNVDPVARGAQPPTREGHRPDRARRVGRGMGGRTQGRTDGHAAPRPPTPPPAGLRGPLRCRGLLSGVGPGMSVGPGITHPVYTLPVPPIYPSQAPTDTARPRHARPDHGPGTPRTCTYDHFETVLGEPRGAEYRRVSGSRDWFIDCLLVHTAV